MAWRESKTLPEHVEKMESGGMACMHCGGEVGEDGMSMGYDDDMDSADETAQEEHLDEQQEKALWGQAMKGRK